MRVFARLALAAFAILLPLKADAKSYTALYRGVIVTSVDPTDRHRILVHVPDLLGDVSVWASPCVPYDGDPAPVLVPPAGSSVWILFEEGNIEKPVWIGWIPGSAPAGGDPVAAPPSGR